MNLNKKGFTLVELLAVIVILALLIVIVANTAIPAMNNAKKKSLETYAKKVMQKAKENCAAEKMANMGNMCNGKTCCGKLTVAEIMGEANSTYTGDMTTSYNNSMGKITAGCISDGTNYVTIDSTSGTLTKDKDNNTTFTAGTTCPTT